MGRVGEKEEKMCRKGKERKQNRDQSKVEDLADTADKAWSVGLRSRLCAGQSNHLLALWMRALSC